MSDIVGVLRRIGSPDRMRAHYDGCERDHVTCACMAAAAEIQRLRAEVECRNQSVDTLLDLIAEAGVEVRDV